MTSEKKELISFPCVFPIKVIGNTREAFIEDVNACVLELMPEFKRETIETRPSAKGNYLALTVRVTAQSQEHLDSIYRALGRVAGVRFVL